MKYIDTNKLKEEIERQLSALDKVDHLEAFEVGKAWNRGHRKALEEILFFIDCLQQEMPSLSSDLDEAAEKYSDKYCSDWAYRLEYEDAFIAGAEWMKEKLTVK